MPTSEISELRKKGLLNEAFMMAKAELEAAPGNIWAKRNIAWVYYEFAKRLTEKEDFEGFIRCLKQIMALALPPDEVMIFDQLAWKIGKIVYKGINEKNSHIKYLLQIFHITRTYSFSKPSPSYSYLFKAFNKAFKNHGSYLEFADWWGLMNFEEKDYKNEDLPNGKKVMALAEQAYINYAKHLLPQTDPFGTTTFDPARAEAFLTSLTGLIASHPDYQYPSYYKAKLLLALGDTEHGSSELLPFLKKKMNDFWAWQLLAEAFPEDKELVFACYCRALLCKGPEEMLVKLRLKTASLLLEKKMFNHARAEIDKTVEVRTKQGWGVPTEAKVWMASEWYLSAQPKTSNFALYKSHAPKAEALLYKDIPEETVFVEFVNTSKKMLNYLAQGDQSGFFKYERFLDNVTIGDTLKIRIQNHGGESPARVYSAVPFVDEEFRRQFIKPFDGTVKIMSGKPFGFIDDIFISPDIVSRLGLVDGMPLKGNAIKTYERKKGQWGWKYLQS